MVTVAKAMNVNTPSQPRTEAAEHRPFQRHDLNPQHGEKYLQIAAYGPKSLEAYLRILEGQGRHPLVAPGPVENIYRVLVGPFTKTEELETARRSIQALGIDPIVRSY
jgi:cell division septation protein DedD